STTNHPSLFDQTVHLAANLSPSTTPLRSDAAGNNQTSPTINLTVNIADTTPPTVAMTAPPNGSSYNTPQTVTLQADASDNVAVVRVDFYDGGTLRGSDSSAPYSFDWTVSIADNGSHAWSARAFDGAGNATTSPAVNLTVNIADTTAPTV